MAMIELMKYICLKFESQYVTEHTKMIRVR